MPFKSKKQKRFFGLCKGNPSKATEKCPPKSVIDEFFREEKRMGKKKNRRKGKKGKKGY